MPSCVFFKKALYFPVGSVGSCILDCVTVRFFLLLSGIVFYVSSDLAAFPVFFSLLRRADGGDVSILRASAKKSARQSAFCRRRKSKCEQNHPRRRFFLRCVTHHQHKQAGATTKSNTLKLFLEA